MTKFLGEKFEYSKKDHDVGKEINLMLDLRDGTIVLAKKNAQVFPLFLLVRI
jgi:hypothetical protein